MHIYDWLENFKKDECKDIHLLNLYRFLDFRTREAFWQYENSDKKPKVIIFCTYKDKRYKIVGASRLGDIWLNTNPCTYSATIELFEDSSGIKSTGITFNIYLTLYRGWA